MQAEFDRRSKQYLVFRLLIILLAFGLVRFYQVSLGPVFREQVFYFLYGLLSIYVGLGLAFFALHGRLRTRPDFLKWQVSCDVVMQSFLVWGTGGVLSIFSPLLFVTLAAATSVISARGAFVLATLATGFLTMTTVAYSMGFAPVNPNRMDWFYGKEKSTFVVSYLLASIIALYTISTLGSRYSHGLRGMEEIQSEILENIAEGLIAVDREGRVLGLNREARKLLGLAEDESDYRKLPIESLLPGKELASLHEAFREDGRRRLRVEVGLAGGPKTPVEVKISTVRDDRGKVRCRIGLISDLRLRKEIEAAERRIQKLEDLQIMAVGIAHEIRNPLASIRGCVQELSRNARGDATAGRYMDIVCRESDRLDRILEDFMVYARSGPVDLAPLDLVQVIEEAAVLLKARPLFKQRQLTFAAPAERPRIFGDRNRLIQVFLNLGLNAIEATSPVEGKIAITLRGKRFAAIRRGSGERDPVDGVEVEVADNGTGIPSGEFRKLFTPFFTTKDGGNGLGLCIVDGIVREHMGHVDCTSEEGKGTTFRLWFPRIATRGLAGEGAAEERERETSLSYSHV